MKVRSGTRQNDLMTRLADLRAEVRSDAPMSRLTGGNNREFDAGSGECVDGNASCAGGGGGFRPRPV